MIVSAFSLKKFFLYFSTIVKDTFHLQLQQNTGHILHVVQYILKPSLHLIAYTSFPPTPWTPVTPTTGHH